MVYETLTISLRSTTLARLEPLLRAAAESEWEDDVVQSELVNLANDLASRLQRIAVGDIQPQDE